jgi:hypothetical protein
MQTSPPVQSPLPLQPTQAPLALQTCPLLSVHAVPGEAFCVPHTCWALQVLTTHALA